MGRNENRLKQILNTNTYAFSKPIRKMKRNNKKALLVQFYRDNEEEINKEYKVTNLSEFFDKLYNKKEEE